MKIAVRFFAVLLGLAFSVLAEETKCDSSFKPLDADFIRWTLEGLSIDSSVAFGSNLPGQVSRFHAQGNEIAFTFDACGGGYNADLISFLRRESIPATLFISGSWLASHRDTVLAFAKDTLFEIENHGLFHRVPTINGRSVYGIKPTRDAKEVVEEIEGGARIIESLTGQRPRFFRPATGFMDETSMKISKKLDMTVVNWDVASGDAVPAASAQILADQILSHVQPGSIVIMHFNHPRWNEKTALERVIPILRKRGYRFIKLKDRL